MKKILQRGTERLETGERACARMGANGEKRESS